MHCQSRYTLCNTGRIWFSKSHTLNHPDIWCQSKLIGWMIKCFRRVLKIFTIELVNIHLFILCFLFLVSFFSRWSSPVASQSPGIPGAKLEAIPAPSLLLLLKSWQIMFSDHSFRTESKAYQIRPMNYSCTSCFPCNRFFFPDMYDVYLLISEYSEIKTTSLEIWKVNPTIHTIIKKK